MGLLDGKVAIVTGAGNGVGRGEAIQLAKHGAKVVVNDVGASVTGDSDGDKRSADGTVEYIKSQGGEAVANYDSVAEYESAGNIINTALDAFGGLDILVNNAGILRDKMLFSMTPEDFDAVVKVHLYGTFNTMQQAAQYWRAQSKAGNQPSAAIVNTISSGGLQGQASQTNYGASKAGIWAMTVIASLELASYGVRANCIGPGGFTRMVGQAMKIEVKNPEEYDAFDAMNPGNSAPGVVWLASDASKPITGQVLRVVGNNVCVYKPFEMGEQYLSVDNDGNATQWDPAQLGQTLLTYHWKTINPGITTQVKPQTYEIKPGRRG
jgi:NAD(P)-dependent dehydrogenase (short-subunit alcohol dehydrogenase family)